MIIYGRVGNGVVHAGHVRIRPWTDHHDERHCSPSYFAVLPMQPDPRPVGDSWSIGTTSISG